MNLSNLKPASGSVRKNKRLGRGTGSGRGGTSTRGHKGAQSRSGYSSKRGFEGGQMPLQRRIPKFGFKNINRIDYHGVNLDVLQKLVEKHKLNDITPQILLQHGIGSKTGLIKILGRGELKAKVNISANAFTASAKKAIEDKGGVATQLK